MKTKIVSQLNEHGHFIGEIVADESPLEPGVFLIPAGAVDAAPPVKEEGKIAKWQNGWVYESELIAETEPLPNTPTPEQIVRQYVEVVQNQLDAFAQTRNYDGILSAATYATSSVPQFAAEGQYAVEARDSTWAKCYEVLAAVEASSRPMPTMDELLAELPVLTWPN